MTFFFLNSTVKVVCCDREIKKSHQCIVNKLIAIQLYDIFLLHIINRWQHMQQREDDDSHVCVARGVSASLFSVSRFLLVQLSPKVTAGSYLDVNDMNVSVAVSGIFYTGIVSTVNR